MKCLYRALAAFALVLAGADAALAQGWPNRPIRMIVPYTPGGYTDLMARLVGQKISDALGQPIVFENKPGANAIIGTDAVAKAAAKLPGASVAAIAAKADVSESTARRHLAAMTSPSAPVPAEKPDLIAA